MILIKKTITVSRDNLVDLLCDETGIRSEIVSMVMNAMEKIIFRELSAASKTCGVSIRPFKGIILESKKVEKRKAINPRDGSPIVVPERIKTSARFTRTFSTKINEKEDKEYDSY